MPRRVVVTFEKILSRCLELRLHRDQTDAALLTYIYDVEQDKQCMDELINNGCQTIDSFLKTHHIAEPARYRNFVAGLQKVGRDAALEIGSDATIIAAQATGSQANRAKYVDSILDWKKKHKLLPTRETAKHILMQTDPRSEVPKATKQVREEADELNKLRAENTALRARVRVLEAENKDLSKQLNKFRRAAA